MTHTWETLTKAAYDEARSQNLGEEYISRLDFEFAEVEKQGGGAYWLNLFNDGKKFDSNPNGLLLPWLLGMMVNSGDHDPLSKRQHPILNTVRFSKVVEYKKEHGMIPVDFIKDQDMPDIDLDCLPAARDPIKQYAMDKYGAGLTDGVYGPVCSVGTWQTYKFRSAIIDVCVATGMVDKSNAYTLTTSLPDEVDDLKEGGKSRCKGHIIDQQTAEKTECGTIHDLVKCPDCGSPNTEGPTVGKLLAEHDQLKKFAKTYKDVIKYAVRIIGRVRNMGMHAGALIIADRNLYGSIPMAKSRSGYWVSMWSEGRNTQLSKFGYVKWDILGLKTLEYIFECCKLIQQNRGISFGDPTKALIMENGESPPSMSGWEDIDPTQNRAGHFFDRDGNKHYIELNDKHVLKYANDLKTDAVFQFDTDLAKSILANGVRNFEDLMLFNAMGHPGPMASIPEAVANREDKHRLWANRLPAEILPIVEDTYGVICYHEDTLISNASGSHHTIRDLAEVLEIKAEDDIVEVHSIDLDTGLVRSNPVLECKPTFITDGLKITLENGYSFSVTEPHRVLCWDGYSKASDIKLGDLVATPKHLPQSFSIPDFAEKSEWLGNAEDCAYLIGQLVGDGLTSSTSYAICAGSKDCADILAGWILLNLDLRCNVYFHCRSWYVGLSNSEKVEPSIVLPSFEDTEEWWKSAYKKYSGSDISVAIGRSTWFVYDRLKEYCDVDGERKRSAKTKWHKYIEDLGLDVNLYVKRIPTSLLAGPESNRSAFLAGLIDSDGTISTNEHGVDIVHITSESPLLIEDLRQLLLVFGLRHTVYRNRIYIWSTDKLNEFISPYLLLKSFQGESLTGDSMGYIPKEAFVKFVDDNFQSRRDFARKTKVSRKIFNYDSKIVRTSTAKKAGMPLNDLLYFRVVDIDPVENQQFYDLTVDVDHNLVANGIVASNCYQEQLQAIWQQVASFTAPEAQEARKAVAKKWAHKLKPIREKWITGATRALGKEEATDWWAKMETFGRYAFNRCLSKDNILVDAITKENKSIEEWKMSDSLPSLYSYNEDGDVVVDECVAIHDNGEMEVFEVEFENGSVEMVTINHKFLCDDGKYHELQEIVERGLDITQIEYPALCEKTKN